MFCLVVVQPMSKGLCSAIETVMRVDTLRCRLGRPFNALVCVIAGHILRHAHLYLFSGNTAVIPL